MSNFVAILLFQSLCVRIKLLAGAFTHNVNAMSKEARRYIAELFKIVGTNSILIVMPAGKLKRLYCPFWVICKVDVPPLQKDQEYAVEAIKMTRQKQDVFIIEGKAYFVWYFSIKA